MGSVAGTSANSCSQCGAATAPENLVMLWGQPVCGTCKPDFVRRMQEGTAATAGAAARRYKGFWIRVTARLIDSAIMAAILLPLGRLLVTPQVTPGTNPVLAMEMVWVTIARSWSIYFLIWLVYYTLLHGRFGATLGKMAIGARVVNADGSRIGYAKAFGRCFADAVSAMIIDIGYIMAGFDGEKRALHDRICGTRVVAR